MARERPRPVHPYVPELEERLRTGAVDRREFLKGAVPSALDPPSGCPFHTRCSRKLGGFW